MRPSFVPSVRSEASARRPPSLVPPPQRPSRRQCRSAASRTAGTLNRSRHPQQKQAPHRGPPSPVPGAQRSARARPGKSPGRGRSPFLVSASGGKNRNHFSSRHVRDEKYLSRSDVWTRTTPFRAVLVCTQAEWKIIEPAPPKGRWLGISSSKCSSVHLDEILYISSTWNTPSMAMMSRRRPSTVCLRSMRMVKMAQALCFSLPLERVISRFTTLSPCSR